MTTCPRCGAQTTDLETCAECGQTVDTASAESPESAAATTTEATPSAVAEDAVAEDAQEEAEDEADAPAAAKPSRWGVRRPAAIATGVGLLGLVIGAVAGFGVGHAQTSGDGGAAAASGALSLPSTLTGGYKRSKAVDTEIAGSVSSAQNTLGAGTDMALYTHKKTQLLVEATRLPGQAFLNAGMTYAKVGDAVCASASGSTGSEAICTRSTDALTVQVTATDSATASKYADEVYAGLA